MQLHALAGQHGRRRDRQPRDQPPPRPPSDLSNTAAPDADAIAALLESAPTPHVIPGVRQGWFTALAFALSEPDGRFVSAFITSEDARYGFVGHGYGIFDLTEGGGAVIRLADAMDGTADMTTLAYGNAATGAWLAAVLMTMGATGRAPPAGLHRHRIPGWRINHTTGGCVSDRAAALAAGVCGEERDLTPCCPKGSRFPTREGEQAADMSG